MDSYTHRIPGVGAPVLTAQLLGPIHQLNYDYLELLIAQYTSANLGGMHYLPDCVLEGLCKTSHAARQMLAKTAYSLYSLNFENQEFWRSALRTETEAIEDRYGVLSTAIVQSSFCEIALLHVWHVCVSQPIAASVLYGIPTSIIDGLSHARLWQLRRIAVDYPGLLMPRAPGNPCFWPEMVKFAAAGDLRRLYTLQQLGHQLIAIDLQASPDQRSAIRDRQHNLLKQRLHR